MFCRKGQTSSYKWVIDVDLNIYWKQFVVDRELLQLANINLKISVAIAFKVWKGTQG
jgi:hypothetical protein